MTARSSERPPADALAALISVLQEDVSLPGPSLDSTLTDDVPANSDSETD